MTHRIRPARRSDIDALYGLAELTGGGFTNLPADRDTLTSKLERAAQAFERSDDTPSDDLYVFILEEAATGTIRGTCQIFGSVGVDRPFYSYLIATLTQKSEALGKVFRNQTLRVRRNWRGFLLYILAYSVVMQPACVLGYTKEMFNLRKSWGTK